jgi:hypothetical protein
MPFIFILIIFSAILVSKPISYETLAYHINQREETVLKVLVLTPGGGQGENSIETNFVPPNSGSRTSTSSG